MAMNLKRIYMLASDHRWQWEEWCDSAGVARPRIAEVKQLIFEAFLPPANNPRTSEQTARCCSTRCTAQLRCARRSQPVSRSARRWSERACSRSNGRTSRFTRAWPATVSRKCWFAIGPSGRKVRRTGRCASFSSSRRGAGASECRSSWKSSSCEAARTSVNSKSRGGRRCWRR